MKKWVLKVIVQKTISYLPFSNKINYVFQKYVTKGVYLSDEYFYDRLEHAKAHIEGFKASFNQSIPQTCLELGTGWYPVVPICLYLSGAEKIYSVDITFLTSKQRMMTTMAKIIEARQNGKLDGYLTIRADRWEKFMTLWDSVETLSLDKLLSELKIIYLIEDARQLSLSDNSIDLINSNNTFEHIYPEILIPIIKDFKRVVKKNGGLMSHFIDMSDHFAHFDKSINIYNFLQFSDNQWKWIDNSIQPQSRSRIDDYYDIYKMLDIPISEEHHREGNIEELKTIKLAEKYTSKSLETIAISHCHFISKM